MKVKTQGGKVITKDGKVSCSCCEQGLCCFYHTQALANGTYAVDDLPDEIIYNNPFGDPISLFKGVWSFGEYPNATISGAYFGRSEPEFEDGVLYYGFDSFNQGWQNASGIDASPGSCLFADQFQDAFANSYQISGSISGTVNRQSLCVWQGENLALKYDGLIGGFGDPGDPPIGSYKWKVNGNNKSGFQNSPVGSYAGGFTVS